MLALIKEFWGFLKEDKKLWLLPIVLILVLIGLLLTSGSGVSGFTYTLF